MKVKVAKFSLYPKDDPEGYAVGFNVTADSGRGFYRDTLVIFEHIPQGSNDEDVVSIAWQSLKEGIEDEVSRLNARSSIVGATWRVPDGGVVEDEDEEPVEDDESEDNEPEIDEILEEE